IEVALSVVLLVGAGLLLRSFSAVLKQNPGLEPHGLIAGQIWVPVPNNPEANRYLTPAEQAALARQLLDRLMRIPGVRRIALGSSGDLPLLNNSTNAVPFSLPDEPATRDDSRAAQFGSVSAGYFDALETPLIAGRFFTDHDDANAPGVVVVNQAFARRFGPRIAGQSLVGERLRVGRSKDLRIVGIVGDIRTDGLDVQPEPHVYQSILQRSTVALAVFLRTSDDIRGTRGALTRAVRDVDPELPVFAVRTMEDLMSSSMARRRFSLELISAFAVSALLLAAFGLYGIVAFVVRQRQHEFGVRIALGAQSGDIATLVLGPGLLLTSAGIVVGIAASLGLTRLISALLVGVSANDPMTLLGVSALLLAVTAAACMVPVSRAVRVSPTEALRG
ncbi:MAG TPA: ABC transporter permease, partial [Gemmatimonadaceae bacterium]|nr:ABC transporter permease [Gemmatimonadaceae bacterium]